MADDLLTVLDAAGATQTLRARDVGSNKQAQKVDVGPWLPSVVTGAQYNQTVTTSVFSLTVPATATHVLLSIETADVRYTEDGSSPSSTNGILLRAGFIGELPLPGGSATPLRFTRVSADAKLNATYRRYV